MSCFQKYACLLTRHKRSTSIATPRSGPILTQACINIVQHMMMVLKMECGDVEDEIKNGWKMGKTKVSICVLNSFFFKFDAVCVDVVMGCNVMSHD